MSRLAASAGPHNHYKETMMRTKLKVLLAVSGTMIALTACGGGDDDGAIPGARSPDDGTTAPQGDGTAGSGCPVLSDADAARALGVESLTFDGPDSENCTWHTSEGGEGTLALAVLKDEPYGSGSPAERAESAGEGNPGAGTVSICEDGKPRQVTVPAGAAIACDAGIDQGFLFAENGDQYRVQIGDVTTDMAKKVDIAAKVLPKIKLPDG